MKICLHLIIISIIFLSACSTNQEVIRNAKQRIQITYWKNGKVKQICPMLKNKIHGLVKSFYENGNLLSVVPYHLGVPNGTITLFNPQGKLETEVSYIAGKVDGSVISFYKNGKPRESLPYYQDQLYGEAYEYYKSGLVNVSTVYSNWSKHGEEIVYNQKGWPLFETPYQYGVDIGYSNIINYKHKRMSQLYSKNNLISLSKILVSKDKYNLIWPVMGGGVITCVYGMRIHPVTGLYKLHTGVDIAFMLNQPILAAADGIVVHAGWYGGYGKAVKISHDSHTNFQTLYAHMNKIIISAGDIIKQGQIIGFMGNTGKVTGIHLHFEVRISNVSIDPMLYYRQTKLLLAKK